MSRPREVVYPLFIPFRGCPHRCVYCDQQAITGAAGPVDVRREMETMLAASGGAAGGELAFYGGTFSNLPEAEQERLLDEAAPFLDSGAIRGIRLSTRPDALSPGRLAHLAARGVTTIELGLQSLDDRVLAAAGRGHTAEDVRRGAAMVLGAGIRLGLQLMTNLPSDTREIALASARGTADLGPAFVRIYPTLVLAGTDLERLWRNGAYTSWSLDETVEVVSRMAAIFRERDITIARIGLPPLEGRETSVLAGPLHPRLGDLVRRRLATARPQEYPRHM